MLGGAGGQKGSSKPPHMALLAPPAAQHLGEVGAGSPNGQCPDSGLCVLQEVQPEQNQTEGARPQHSSQSPAKGDSPPATAPSMGPVPCTSEMLSPSQTLVPGRPSPDGATTEIGPSSLEEHLPKGVAEHDPEPGASQGEADTPLPAPNMDPEPPFTATSSPEQSPGGPIMQACQSSQGALGTSTGPLIITDVRPGPKELQERALDRAEQDRGDFEGDHSRALPLTRIPKETETLLPREGEPRKDEPHCVLSVDPTSSQVPCPTNQEPTVVTEHANPPTSEVQPTGTLTQEPSCDPGDVAPMTLPTQALGEVCCPSQSLGCQLGPPAPLDIEDEADWGSSLVLELDFLPDSLIQGAVDAPNTMASYEQVRRSYMHPEGQGEVEAIVWGNSWFFCWYRMSLGGPPTRC